MKIVLDCNVVVMALTSRSPYHKIYSGLTNAKFELLVSDEILLEYEEIIGLKYNEKTARFFSLLLNELPNVRFQRIYYNWNLIAADPDDNKYVDCYIAGKGDYIVTQDKHFQVLKDVPFPRIRILTIDEFLHQRITD